MMLLIFLRAAGDLAFYYAFAALFVSLGGSAFCLPCILLPALCCAAASRLAPGTPSSGDRTARNLPSSDAPFRPAPELPIRIAFILPALICFVLPGMGKWDRIAYLPAFLYSAYLILCGRCDLSHERQREVFLLFGKTYPLFFFLALVAVSPARVFKYSLPYAAGTAVICVFLLRTLRHDEEVYGGRKFLARNLLALLVFLSAAAVLQLPAVTGTALSILSGIYSALLVPVIMGIIYGIARILSPLMELLISLVPEGEEVTLTTEFSISELGEETSSGSSGIAAIVGNILQAAAVCLVIAAVCLLLFYLFRRLAGNAEDKSAGRSAEDEIRSGPENPGHAGKKRAPLPPFHPVNQVRRSYREYLKLCRKKGFSPPDYYTSSEICSRAAELFAQNGPDDDPAAADRSTAFITASEQLRELYIKARYHKTAASEDAAAAKALLEELKKTL